MKRIQPVDWALTRPDLSAPKHLLLVGIAWLSDGDGVTFKSQLTISERLGKDARWIRQHISGLEDADLITRYRRHRDGGSRTTDLIVLNMPREAELDLDVYSGTVGKRVTSGENPPVELPAGLPHPTGGFSPPLINLVETKDLTASSKTASSQTPVEQVFEAWKQSAVKTNATVLSAKRKRIINAALADYPLDDVLDAVRGWLKSPWHCGETNGTVYNKLELLLRDAGQIEMFRDLQRNTNGHVQPRGEGFAERLKARTVK